MRENSESAELVGAVEVTEDEVPPTDGEISEKKKPLSRTDAERIHYQFVNDRVVNDITLEVLYKPHTISLLILLCGFLLYKAFADDGESTEVDVFNGLKATGALFLILSALVFPNGPFIRPHPIIWRIVFGLSVVYVLILQFTLFQTYDNVKSALTWLDPEGLGMQKLKEKEYAVDCWNITLERMWSYMDIFAVGHFLGWAMKALLIRHYIICWYISISWELTEVVFAHLLPNFQECWWDAILLDVVICNGLGIWFGMQVCKLLEMRSFHWESIKNIRTARGKFKRAVLQFTPESWIKVDWFNSFALRRTLALYLFIMIWLVSELNTFFLKHVLAVDTSHPVVFWRIILIGLISAPTIRQYYSYVTDPKVKRLGMQCWIFCAVTALESAVCIKFGRHQLPGMKATLIIIWIILLAAGTVFCAWLSVWWAKSPSITHGVNLQDGIKRHFYLDSSYENLGAIGADVPRMRFSSKVLSNLRDVRVRFAPSPTGKLHLGSLRTALFNYLFAKRYHGKFVLRIEDTDQQRIVPGCAEKFEKTLNEFSLRPDESPLNGGEFGPYVQSQRRRLYAEMTEVLLNSGHAYRCFCSSERLEILRKNAMRTGQIPRYDNRCRNLSGEEIKARVKDGESSVVRFKFDKQQVFFYDVVYGENSQTIDEGDFVIIKSDGFPTYHFANIVDDHGMEISHVIRGAEWLPSTPKHVKLYKAFNWTPPKFIHLPLITRDGQKKLSKRDADAFVGYYTAEKGYLPLAILNFLLRNGSGIRNFEVGKLYSLGEMIEKFDEKLIGTRDFMMDKASLENYGRLAFKDAPKSLLLDAIGSHVQSNFPEVDPDLLKPDYIERVVVFLNQNEESFSCLSELSSGDFKFFFGRPKSAATLLQKFPTDVCVQVLDRLLALEKIDLSSVKTLAKDLNLKPANLMGIVRCSLIDSFQGPPLSELFGFFSEEECRTRLTEMRMKLEEK